LRPRLTRYPCWYATSSIACQPRATEPRSWRPHPAGL
jgi:hypothetical protein